MEKEFGKWYTPENAGKHAEAWNQDRIEWEAGESRERSRVHSKGSQGCRCAAKEGRPAEGNASSTKEG
jgi:hypothetical protein